MSTACRTTALAATTMLCALPLAVGAQTQTFSVDCARGERISHALERGDARKPMTLLVSGTCTENVSIQRDDVNLKGSVGSTPILAAPSGAAPALTIHGTRVIVDGFTVNGGSSAILVGGTHDVTIVNSVIRNAAQNGLNVESGNVLARNSTFTGNGGAGVFLRYSRARLESNQIRANSGAGINVQQQSVLSSSGNVITGNGAQGVYLYFGSSGGFAGDTIDSNVGSGVQLTIDSRANIVGATITGNDNGIHAGFSHVTIAGGSVNANRRSGIFLTSSRSELTDATVDANGNQGIGGIVGSTVLVTRGSISSNGQNGISISHNGTVSIGGAAVRSNGAAGILVGYATKLVLGATDASGNGGWGLDCLDPETSVAGGPLIGTVGPGCTGY